MKDASEGKLKLAGLNKNSSLDRALLCVRKATVGDVTFIALDKVVVLLAFSYFGRTLFLFDFLAPQRNNGRRLER